MFLRRDGDGIGLVRSLLMVVEWDRVNNFAEEEESRCFPTASSDRKPTKLNISVEGANV
jgi:hypothetical protein